MAALEYRIVDSSDRQSVENEINDLLQEGWSLHGTLSVAVTGSPKGGPGLPVGIFYFAQALTREREERSVFEDRGLYSV